MQIKYDYRDPFFKKIQKQVWGADSIVEVLPLEAKYLCSMPETCIKEKYTVEVA